MGKIASKIFKLVTLIFGVAVLICAIYLMATGAGLQEGLDFGAGAYYYADIPEFQKFLIDGLREGTMAPAPYGGGNVSIDENGVEHMQDDYQIYGIDIIDKRRSVL